AISTLAYTLSSLPPPPRSAPFPYTTLFRSQAARPAWLRALPVRLLADVQRVPEAVAQQVEAENGHHDGDTRHDGPPPLAREQIVLALRGHPSPARRWWRHPKAQEGEGGFQIDVTRHGQGRLDQHRGDDVGQDVAEDDDEVARPDGLRRLHVLVL